VIILEKKAIVLCGGGGKGAYQIGAWKALRKLGFKPDIVTGTSVGALNGSFIVSNKFKEAISVWSDINMEKVLSFDKNINIEDAKSILDVTKLIIKNGNSASYDPLLKLIDEYVSEEEIRKSKIEYGFVTTQFMPLKKVEKFKEDIPVGQLKDYIMASAACYPYMKSYTIGKNKYIDGGYFDNMPIEMAIKKGATDIVVIDLKGIGRTNTTSNLPAKITYVSSRHNLGSIMIFNKDISIRNINLGYYDTMKAFNELEGDLYTFNTGSKIKASKYEKYMMDIYSKVFSNLPVLSPFELAAKNSIKEYFDKYNRELFSINSNVLTSLEFAADTFDINMIDIYSFKKLSKLVIDNYNNINSDKYDDIFDLKNIIKNVIKVDGIKDIKNTYDKKNLICYICNLLDKETLEFSDKKEIWVFSILVPEIVIGAIFICAYKNNKKLINI
jgi:NTE family protein